MTSTAALPVLAQDLEAERAVLGSLLLDPASFDLAADLLGESDFARSAHRTIFGAMHRLVDRDDPLDNLTLSDELQRAGQLEAVGGAAYLAELIQDTPSAANLRAHCRIVREQAQRRRLIQIGATLQLQAQDPERSVADVVETAERELLAVQQGTRTGNDTPIGEIVIERLARLQEIQRNPAMITGVPTGFPELDTLLGGLHAGNLVIIGARPSMGKTSLALNIAAHLAFEQGLPVLIFSLEMSKEELADRLLSATASVSLHDLRTARVKQDGWWRLTEAGQRLHDAPLTIDDTGSVTVAQIRSRARRQKAKHGLALVIVDYLQLLTGQRAESRQQEVSDLSRSLKQLAKELEVPILVLSQLNRELERRENKKPILADLRESGAIEQDADVVMFLYRDEIYNEDSPDRGIAEVLVRKHRNGPVGERRLHFLEQFTRFESKAYEGGTVPNGVRQG